MQPFACGCLRECVRSLWWNVRDGPPAVCSQLLPFCSNVSGANVYGTFFLAFGAAATARRGTVAARPCACVFTPYSKDDTVSEVVIHSHEKAMRVARELVEAAPELTEGSTAESGAIVAIVNSKLVHDKLDTSQRES